jgi:hypothetical protein
VNQETELWREHGHGLVAVNSDYVQVPVVHDGQVPDPVAPDRDCGFPDAAGALDAERPVRRDVTDRIVAPDCFLPHNDHRRQQADEMEAHFIAITSEGLIRVGQQIRGVTDGLAVRGGRVRRVGDCLVGGADA